MPPARMRAPPLRDLMRYCRCVAGAVGLLSIRVFGARRRARAARRARARRSVAADQHPARPVRGRGARSALSAARAAPAAPGRRRRSRRAPCTIRPAPRSAMRWPLRARARFADAERHFGRGDRRQLRPALVMMHVYRRTLDRLIARGWRRLDDPVRLAKARAAVAGAALRPALSAMAAVHVVGAGLAGLAAAVRLAAAGAAGHAVRGRAAGRRPLSIVLRPHARTRDRQRQSSAGERQSQRARLPRCDRRVGQPDRPGGRELSVSRPHDRRALDGAAESRAVAALGACCRRAACRAPAWATISPPGGCGAPTSSRP